MTIKCAHSVIMSCNISFHWKVRLDS